MKFLESVRVPWILGLVISAFLGVGVSYSKFYIVHPFLLTAPVFLLFMLLHSSFKEFMKTYWGAIFWAAYFILSISWSENRKAASLYAVMVVMGVLIVVSTSVMKDQLPKILKILGWLTIISLGLGLLEAFTPFRYPISKFSPLAGFFNKSIVQDDLSEPYPTAFFWTTNNFCFVLLVALPFFTLLRKRWQELMILTLTTLLVLKCSSRGVLALLSVYILIRGASFILKGYQVKKIFLVLSSILIIFIPLSYFSLSHDNVLELKSFGAVWKRQTAVYSSFITGDKYDSLDRTRREVMLQETIELWKDHKLFGAGGGQLAGKTTIFKSKSLDLSTPHHYWAELLAFGGIFFVSILMTWFIFLFKKLGEVSSELSTPARTSFVLFILGAPACSTLVYFFPAWLFLGLIALIASKANFSFRNKEQNETNLGNDPYSNVAN